MRERPILFNTEMVMALLNGTKTCTRRVVRYKYSNTEIKIKKDKYGARLIEIQKDENSDGSTYHKLLPFVEKEAPYRLGDILYVRETWCLRYDGEKYFYKADKNTPREEKRLIDYNNTSWRPSIHMPKEAARIWLKVTDVRVERLQDITDDGAKAEGANWKNGKNVGWEEKMRRTAVERFAEIWNSTIKKSDLDRYGWNANPYVWVIEFERCEKPGKE